MGQKFCTEMYLHNFTDNANFLGTRFLFSEQF